MKAITTALSALSLAACAPTPATTSFGTGEPPTSVSGTEASTAASTTSNAASTSTSDPGSTGGSTGTSSGAVPDLGTMPDLGSPLPAGCEGKKIDFLFVISNSSTMESAQKSLLAAFPGFMDAIEAKDIDKHILVTTSLPMWRMSDCADCISDCDQNGSPTQCGAELTACDSMLGAAYTFPTGKGATNRRCTLAGGTPYITSKEVQVDSAFKCLATVGIDGSNAYAAGAVRAAISPAMNSEGACNDGFLRKDALLVITVIADTDDDDSLDGPKEWAADVLATKNGDPDAAYLLVITTDIDIPGHLCWPEQVGLGEETRLRTWAKMTPNSSVQSICAEDYVPFFEDALSKILDLCESFVPPG